ncbi:hypothetical protein [Brevibacillus sp. SAFN-007a]|uniref:hypothetical protein n=1 Tax=Brevibacillus sp. SAFN-007a TaxID=3436862 RepID=UPI003F81DF34
MHSSWNISMDIPEALNFAIYVGFALELLPDKVLKDKDTAFPEKKLIMDESYSIDDLKSAWNEWWHFLVHSRQEQCVPKLERPHTTGIESGKFKKLCDALWVDFYKWWSMPAGGKMAMVSYTTLGRKEIRKIIHEMEEQTERSIQPFSLKIDLVYSGLDSVIDVTPTYAVMPINPPPYYNTTWWKRKISTWL